MNTNTPARILFGVPVLMLPCALASCTGSAILAPGIPFNFHVIEDGRAYRSAQPTGDELAAAVAQFGIRTIVNLRGENVGKDWYDEEVAACEALGVHLVNHAISARSLPPADKLTEIIETLKTAEYPILLHCDGGSDRTGAVAAVYRMLLLGQDRQTAQAELSIAYLHFNFYAPCMDRLAEIYEPTDEWLIEYAATRDEISCTP